MYKQVIYASNHGVYRRQGRQGYHVRPHLSCPTSKSYCVGLSHQSPSTIHNTSAPSRATMAAPQPPSPFSRLCQKCKVLELDEKSLPDSALDASVPECELALDWGLVPQIDVLKAKSCDSCHLVSSIISSWQLRKDLAHLPEHNRRASLCYVIRQKRLEALRIRIHHGARPGHS